MPLRGRMAVGLNTLLRQRKGIIPLNNEIDDETAAQLIGMPISALMLLDFVNVQPGQWLFKHGEWCSHVKRWQ